VATISSLLADHVTLQVRSVDRLFFQGYVPRLQTQFQVIRFLLDRGFPIPSPVVLGRIGREYVKAVDRYIAERDIPRVRFQKGDVKEEIAREHFKAAERDGRFGVVMVGVAQERTSAWRGWREGGSDGHPHFEYRRQQVFPNHYYWYIRDPDWGPAFLKTVAYAPFSVWLYPSPPGHALDDPARPPDTHHRTAFVAVRVRGWGALVAGDRAALPRGCRVPGDHGEPGSRSHDDRAVSRPARRCAGGDLSGGAPRWGRPRP